MIPIKGFTLIEVLVSIAIYGVIAIGLVAFLRIALVSAVQNPLALDSIDSARTVATLFTNEIRSASAGNDGSFPINQASTSQIIFFSPYGSIGSTTINRIRYFYSSSTLYKGITVPSGNPATYNVASEVVSRVLLNATMPTSSVFFYYDGNYNGISSTTPLSQPVNVTQVSYVQIHIATKLNEIRNSTSSFSIITGASIRNLKTNLGN